MQLKYLAYYKSQQKNTGQKTAQKSQGAENKNQNKDKDNAWQLIDKLKLYWKDTSETNKNVIWNYFKQLITLGYMSYNQ